MYKVCCVIAALALFVPVWMLAEHSRLPAGVNLATSTVPESVQRYSGGEDSRASLTLASMRNISRPLLVFAPTTSDVRFIQQMRWLASGAKNARERQIVCVPVVRVGTEESWESVPYAVSFRPKEAQAARGRFRVDPSEFALILVGKDGEEKFRSHVPVTIEKLNALIDAMPMRQQEIRDGHHPE